MGLEVLGFSALGFRGLPQFQCTSGLGLHHGKQDEGSAPNNAGPWATALNLKALFTLLGQYVTGLGFRV